MEERELWDRLKGIVLRHKIRSMAAVVVLGAILFASGQYMLTEKRQQRTTLKPLVSTTTVERRPMYKTISLFGKTVSHAKIDIVNKYPGKVARINVELGDSVEQGQVLLEQELQEIDISIAKADAEYRAEEAMTSIHDAKYNADYYKYKSEYELNKINLERYKKLYELGAVSKLELDKAEKTMTGSKGAFEALGAQARYEDGPAYVANQAQKARAKHNELLLLKNRRNDMILRAPRGGIVSYRDAEVGTYAAAGTKLLTIVDNSSIYIDCSVSDYDAALLQTGQEVNVNVEALGKNYPGRIIFVSPDQQKENKNPAVRIFLKETGGEVKSGMFARSRVDFLQRDSTIFLHKKHIVEKNGKQYVFVINEKNIAEQREVTLGISNAESVEITEGLQTGEVVAASNLSRLRSGTGVDIDTNFLKDGQQ